jgi:glycosyltransferase involved in cell wall biosynthesis
MDPRSACKRIFFVGNTAWSMYNFRLDVIKALWADGYEVSVIAPEDDWSSKLIKEGIHFIPIKMDNRGTSPLNDLKLFWHLTSLYRKHRPDIVFHYTIKPNIYGSIAAGAFRIYNIACVTGAGSVFIEQTFLTKIVKRLFRFSFKFSKQVWFLNDDDRDLFVTSGLVKPFKCMILPSEGIDTKKFAAKSYSQKRNEVSFLFLGRLLWDKGIGEYINAARNVKKKHNHVRFKVLGFLDPSNPSAISQRQLEEWIEEGIIQYLGVSSDVREIVLDSDCVVLPSYYREGIPRSLLEAACLGKSVITTDIPGCREVIDDGITGYFCEPRNIIDLQEKMEKIINMDKETRIIMGQAGRTKVIKLYDMHIIIEKYKGVVSIASIGGNKNR